MKHIYTLLLLAMFGSIGYAQEYTLSLEAYATDIIEGQTTYRLYVDMVNEDDFLSSIYGGEDEPLSITTTTGFYNDTFGAAVASSINPAFFAVFPTIAGDSWVTIGIESLNTGDEVQINTVQSTAQPWTAHFSASTPEDGTDVYMNDQTGGAWYVLNGSPNGLPDENLQVLVMQLTTAGEICGTINCQLFMNGDGQDGDTRLTYTFCGEGTYAPVVAGGGCTDVAACNYDEAATTDDGSCEYADSGYDCDGNCLNDTDLDGVCDEFEVAGCTDVFACNYDVNATENDGTCEFATCQGCTDEEACNYDPTAIYNDGSCDYLCNAIFGCTVVTACNYDPEATYNDGSCDFNSCVGCMDDTACNYDPAALYDNGSCEFTSCEGCMDVTACNFDPDALYDDDSCEYPESGYNCDGICLNDVDTDGVCDEFEIQGCTIMSACNYDASATDDDGTCEYAEQFYDCDGACLMDADDDGVCDELEIEGCTDMDACNYNPDATNEDDSCEFAVSGYDCDGMCLDDADMDGVCDEFEVAGCSDEDACNYDADATDNDGSCEYADEFYDCEGNCLNDADMDGICDELEVNGCTDEMACNYSMDATDDDGSCEYADEFYDCEGNCLNDADMDGICDELEVNGCTDEMACNYSMDATDDDGSCEYAEEFYDCEGNCLNDTDGDGVCDELEVSGCTDPDAENYNADATDDDGSCYYCDIELVADATDEVEGDANGAINMAVTGGTAPYEFSWTGPNDFTSTESALADLSAGTYALTVTDANGCTATIEVVIDNVTGVTELVALEFDVYPNPASESFSIQNAGLNGKTIVEMLDASGRLIERMECNLNGQPISFELNGVETGFYHIVLRNGGKTGAKRLLVH